MSGTSMDGIDASIICSNGIDDFNVIENYYYNLNILPKHNHIHLTLNNGLVLVYNDVRRFGFFKF